MPTRGRADPTAPTSGARVRLPLMLLAAVVVWHGRASTSLAQAPVVVWAAGPTASTGRAELWARRVTRGLERDGLVVSESVDEWARLPPGASRARVDQIASVERAVAEAQALAAALEEAAALVRLAAAEAIARDAIDVPGAVAWYVEVELELAALAHQLDEPSLARACLARAASLAPERHLHAAEAPPDLVAMHDAARSAQRTGPTASTTVDAPGARPASVFVDDILLGPAPARIDVVAGLHAIRVEAPGHVSWARLVELSPGARPPIDVTLAPEPAVAAAREARALAERLELDDIPAALSRAHAEGRAPRALVLVVAGAGVLDRALAIACDPVSCRAPVRLEGTEPARLDRMEREPPATPSAFAALDGWLDEPLPLDFEPPVPPAPEWWTEWWPWAGLGVVVAGGLAAGVGAALAEPTPRGLVIAVTVDPP